MLTLEATEFANKRSPRMTYVDGMIIGPWNKDQIESILRRNDATAVEERWYRRPIDEKELKRIFALMMREFEIPYAKLKIIDAMCPMAPCAVRDLAAATHDTGKIEISRRVLELGEGQCIGLLAHEFGHLADPRFGRGGEEVRADQIAAKTIRMPIRYDRCDVQTIGPGKIHRPEYLHQ